MICGRNDNYGGHLNERATYSINTILETFDEVIYVDWNTESGPILTDAINLKNRHKLKAITITPSMCEELMGSENYKKGQKMCEVLARNVGIRRATGDIVVDTNVDVLVPQRKYLDVLLDELRPMEMITVAKQDVELSDLVSQFGEKGPNDWLEFQRLTPMLFGNWPITKRLMSPHIVVNKALLDQVPINHHHGVASIIMACGDFQIAHRDTWFAIRGFEESMIKRMYIDTNVQYKVIMAGGSVRATNFPPVYHIEHERNNDASVQNSIEVIKVTKNADTWGFSELKV